MCLAPLGRSIRRDNLSRSASKEPMSLPGLNLQMENSCQSHSGQNQGHERWTRHLHPKRVLALSATTLGQRGSTIQTRSQRKGEITRTYLNSIPGKYGSPFL